MQKDNIRILKDQQSLEYIINPSFHISITEYKVLQGIDNINLLHGVKAKHNQCDKMIYDITELKSLNSVISQFTDSTFVSIINKILDTIKNIKNNGFLQPENLDFDLNHIFVDNENKCIYMVYVPLISDECEFKSYELQFKEMLKDAINNNPKLNNDKLHEFCDNFTGESDLCGIQIQSDIPKSEVVFESKSENEHIDEKKGLLSKLFNGKKENNKKEKYYAKQQKVYKNEDEGGSTQLLDSIFIPSIVISGIKTPEKIEVVVNKEKFIIGKNPSETDLTIAFNKAVSGIHCCIVNKNNVNYIEDLKSTNGTYVNGVKIQPKEPKIIKSGDKVRVANTEFVIKSV